MIAFNRRRSNRGVQGMLVFTRNEGQDIIIGGQVIIRIVEVRGRRAKVGIIAPKCIAVDRMEVHQDKLARGTNKPKLA